MAFAFHYRSDAAGRRLALFPGAWNPPTTAHVAIANAACAYADEVVWVLPRELPHKTFHGATFDARLEMLVSIAQANPCFSVATSSGGLYIDIANQARQALGNSYAINLVCGRDAADRIATWEYAHPGVFDDMIAEYPLLVAARAGHYKVADRHKERILPLRMESSFDDVSSSEIRARIAAGDSWRHLVPSAIHDTVVTLYR